MVVIMSAVVVFAGLLGSNPDKSEQDDEKAEAIERALESFAGTWEIVAVEPAGSTRDARRLVFREDMTYAALDADNQELWSGTFDLDPTASPKIWDHRTHESKENGGDALGIYELDGDKMRVACVVGQWEQDLWQGKPRPAEIKLPTADVVLDLHKVEIDKN